MFVLVSVKQYDAGGLVAGSWRRGRREAAGTARSGAPQQGTGNLDGGAHGTAAAELGVQGMVPAPGQRRERERGTERERERETHGKEGRDGEKKATVLGSPMCGSDEGKEVPRGSKEMRRPVPHGLRVDEPSGYSPARDRARRRVAGAGDGWIEEGMDLVGW